MLLRNWLKQTYPFWEGEKADGGECKFSKDIVSNNAI